MGKEASPAPLGHVPWAQSIEPWATVVVIVHSSIDNAKWCQIVSQEHPNAYAKYYHTNIQGTLAQTGLLADGLLADGLGKSGQV